MIDRVKEESTIDVEKMNDYLTVKDVSVLLKIGINKAYKLFQLRDFPCTRIGNKYIISRDKLNEYIDSYEYSHIIL